MIKLYLDCDGVILDTITKIYEIFKNNNIHGEENTTKFYRELDWDKFIIEAGEIDNSISKIKELEEYFDISILTHVNSSSEGESKTKYFNKVLPGVEVLPVDKSIKKADYVNPYNTILVDDYLGNLDYWSELGGISVKFSDSGKQSKYITITNLLELKDIDFSKYMKGDNNNENN